MTNWILIDLRGVVVGRAAAEIAGFLRGKHKPSYLPHLDCGDGVIVINSDHAVFTGAKYEFKKYLWHTGYPGGLKSRTVKDQMERDSTFVVRHAVSGMLPNTKRGKADMRRLRVYPGENHPHVGQNPQVYDFGSRHSSNRRSA